MPGKRNCTRSACVLRVVVSAGFLWLVSNAWAGGVDVPNLNPPPQGLSAAREIALGNDYLFGRGVAQDPEMAAYWFEKAAKAGDPQAQFEMGYLSEAGIGTSKDLERAAHWYQLASSGGLADAKANLGLLYFWGAGVAENKEMAALLFREAAEKGSGKAAYKLGYMYAIGAGVPKDMATAEQWYNKGAKLHDPQAEYELGVLFFYGTDHKVDLKKAESLLRTSAAAGLVPAMHTLGLLLVRHPELAKSPDEGAKFLDAAASAGTWKSSEVLGILARDGTGAPSDAAAAYFHFRVAVLQGGDEAQKVLSADLQRLGSALDPDVTRALDARADEWYRNHRKVLQFVYSDTDSKSKLQSFSLASPRVGEHQLQLVPPPTEVPSTDARPQTATTSRNPESQAYPE